MTLALNVLIPTKPSSVPYTDFTSDTEYSVIPTATLPLLTPLIISCSFLIKLPVFSYTVNPNPAVTDPCKNAFAPLLFPSIIAGTDTVSGLFNFISVNVCTSYKASYHSSKFELVEL